MIPADPADPAAGGMDVAGDYPLPREGALDPPAAVARLRDAEPLRRVATPDGRFPWLVTRYDEVRAVLGDDRFSVDPRVAGVPTTVPAMQARNAAAPTFLTLDDPEHHRLRRTVTGEFTTRRLEAFRPVVHDLVAQQLDRMAAAPGRATDLVASFSLPLASLVICRLLGVPYADHAFFQDRAAVMMSNTSTPEQTADAAVELTDFLRGLLVTRRDDPTDDLIGRLAGEHVATGAIDPDEACGTLVLLLVAGHDTTTYAIALCVLRLLTDDAAAARFRAALDAADDEALARSVEELLRLHDVIHFGHARVALADVEVGGTTVHAGEGVYAVTAAANRDPRVFPDPDRFDPDRPMAHRHLTFGFGVHQCLGQQLARMELRASIPAILRRFPGLRLGTTLDALRFRDDMIVYGPRELPVTW